MQRAPGALRNSREPCLFPGKVTERSAVPGTHLHPAAAAAAAAGGATTFAPPWGAWPPCWCCWHVLLPR